jgi:hypothetical protein
VRRNGPDDSLCKADLNERADRSQVGADMPDKIRNILAVLDAATAAEQINLPGFHLAF